MIARRTISLEPWSGHDFDGNVVTDPSQIDLPAGTRSGLIDALEVLGGIAEVVTFDDNDVVRHAMVTRMVRAYNARDAARSS